jgi:DNA-binding MarR family transcriptional regulator
LDDSASKAGGVDVPVADPRLTMEEVSESIWRLTEEVLELLRTQATSEIQRQRDPDVLWVDDVTRSQGNTVIAVRQLSEDYPEGVTLKKLAETIGVTPAAASVMVDLLVKKKMLKRTRSKSDRRSILIRLAPETSRLFEISEQSLRRSVMSLLDLLGPETLRDWQRILVTAAAALSQVVHVTAPTDQEPTGSSADGNGGPLGGRA